MLLTLSYGLVVVACSVLTTVTGKIISDADLMGHNNDLVTAIVEEIRKKAGDLSTLSLSEKVKIQSSKGRQTKELKNLRLRFDKDKLLAPKSEYIWDDPLQIDFPNAVLIATDGSTELEFPAALFDVEVQCKASEKFTLDWKDSSGLPIDKVDVFRTSITVYVEASGKGWSDRIHDWNNQKYGRLDESALKTAIVKQATVFIKKIVSGLPKSIVCRKVTDKSN